MSKGLVSALFFLASLSVSYPTCAQSVGQASVIDGDTLEIHGQRIRLHGIDAPESSQQCTIDSEIYRCGQKAAFFLDSLVSKKTIKCEQKDRDRYGRIVAECFAGAVNLNASMVQQGWALAYRKYSQDYVQQEEMAKQSKAGMWAGHFQPAWDYRHGPTEAEKGAHGECLIKGNINAKGKRIYHMPGSSAYGRTKINTDKGERWFCSEKEAQNAGWYRLSR
jgi:endonuclease YncB( thermonuclease family)